MKKFLTKHWRAILYILVAISLSVPSFNSKSNQPRTYNSSKNGVYYSDTCPITTCNDSACSKSTGRGTCSHHGGVRN